MVKKYLAPLSILLRWGHNVKPVWIFGDEQTAPPANTTLVSKTVNSPAYVYGFYINSDEGNDFVLEWISNNTTYKYYVSTTTKGTIYFSDTIPLNEGLPADINSTIKIYNMKSASEDTKYRAGIFVGEVIE